MTEPQPEMELTPVDKLEPEVKDWLCETLWNMDKEQLIDLYLGSMTDEEVISWKAEYADFVKWKTAEEADKSA